MAAKTFLVILCNNTYLCQFSEETTRSIYLFIFASKEAYRIVSNTRPGGVAIFQKGDVYKRQVFNAKMQWLSLFTMHAVEKFRHFT